MIQSSFSYKKCIKTSLKTNEKYSYIEKGERIEEKYYWVKKSFA